MSQVMAMAKRLQEAEETIASLRARRDSVSSGEDMRSHRSPPQRTTTTATPAQTTIRPDLPPSLRVTRVPLTEPTAFPPGGHAPNAPALMPYPEPPKQPMAPDLSVDENGAIQYYGPTSAVHDPLQRERDPAATRTPSTAPEDASRTDARSTLMAYAEESKIWEDFALGNASLQTGIPRQVIAKLLHVHWTWVSPMFMYVYRPGTCGPPVSNECSRSRKAELC